MQTTDVFGAALPVSFATALDNPARAPIFRVFVNWSRVTGWNPDTGTGINIEDNISAYVESVDLDRAFTTDVPDGTRLIAGQAVASGVIKVKGNPLDNAQHGGVLWSSYAAGVGAQPTKRKRIGAPVAIEFGLTDGATLRWVRVFTGFIRSIDIDSATYRGTITVLDASDRLRANVRFPLIVANDAFGTIQSRYGLNSQWLIDYALRRNGIYASPPPFPFIASGGVNPTQYGTVVLATCHGSMFPEYGRAVNCQMKIIGDSVFQPWPPYFTPGKFGLAVTPTPIPEDETQAPEGMMPRLSIVPSWTDENGVNHEAPRISYGSFPGVQFEAWLRLPRADLNVYTFGMQLGEMFSTSQPSPTQPPTLTYDSIIGGLGMRFYHTFDGTLAIYFVNGAGANIGTASVSLAAAQIVGQYNRVGAHVKFNTSTSVTVTFVVNDTQSAVTITLSQSWPSTKMGAALYEYNNASYQDMSIAMIPAPSFLPTSWIPNAYIDPGLNELTVSPYEGGPKDAWSLVQDIAKAEFGTAGLDEWNIFRFRNRDTLATAQPTYITTKDRNINLESLSTKEAIDQIINHASITVEPFNIQDYTWVWSMSNRRGLHSRQSISLWVGFGKAVYGIPQGTYDRTDSNGNPVYVRGGFKFIPVGGITSSDTDWPVSGYRASMQPDGTGYAVRNLEFTTEVFEHAAKITITNPNNFPVYLVSPYQDGNGTPLPDTSKGKPMLNILGRPVVSAGAATEGGRGESTLLMADTVDIQSIIDYGEQSWNVSYSIWMQDLNSAQSITDDVVAMQSRPIPFIKDVDIVGDPRLQLADRILLNTIEDTGMSADAYAVGVRTTVDKSGMRQTLSMKGISAPSAWILGRATRSELGQTTVLGGYA